MKLHDYVKLCIDLITEPECTSYLQHIDSPILRFAEMSYYATSGIMEMRHLLTDWLLVAVQLCRKMLDCKLSSDQVCE